MSNIQIIKADLPEGKSRIETGATQIGDDWPGVFIRGDGAFHYAHAVAIILRHVEDPHKYPLDIFSKNTLQSLKELLNSCNVHNLDKED